MKKTSRPVITGIITAVILLAALVSCGNLNIRKQASIVISFGNARSVISYQKSDTAYYMISLQPEVQQPKRVKATQNAAEITGIDEGTYTLLVKAYNANDELIAEGRAENIQVAAGETAAATVQMAAKTYHVHEWDNGTETKAATCTETGILTYTCTDCHATKTEVIPAKGHKRGSNPVTITKKPTCFTDGEQKYTCLICERPVTEPIPALGWCETPIDAETFMPATKSSTSVYFGVFPQTVLPSASNVTVDENESVAIGTQTYYKGSDGEYYVKTDVVPYQPDYTYKDGTTVSSDTRYFRMEPLKWIVLATDYDVDGTNGDKTAALLLANDVLTAGREVVWYEHYNSNHDTTGKPSNYYEDSQARAYLNGISYDAAPTAYYSECQSSDDKWLNKGFLQQAFTDTAKEKIKDTSVDNSKDDKIFLLSISEYNAYKDNILNHYVSDYALAKGQCLSVEWWSRSSDSSSVYRFVDDVKTPSTNNVFPIQKEIGMCPALCIDLPDAN